MNTRTNRRRFLQQTALSGVGVWLGSIAISRGANSPNNKLNIGIIGVAHQGNYDLSNVTSENIVALCDVDDSYLADTSKKFPGAKTYNDFRRLLDQKEIEAVVIATPDHTHAVATVAALGSGRHVYCEKPLTRTISECRVVMEAARRARRATQIGTQIHAGTNYRRVVELVQGGAIGPIDEVHVWVSATYGGKDTPKESPPVPASLHYDLWLGPIRTRPYSPEYLPQAWRNWWAFGGGALGDFGCHYMDLPHWALGLRTPVSAEVVEGPPVHAESVPPWLIVRYQYPSRGQQPALKLTWYHGGKQPQPSVLASDLAEKWKSGVLFVGKKGNLLSDYSRHMLLPEDRFKAFVPPAPSIADSIGHHAEWIRACKTGEPTTCNFEYSGALTESVLLGNVAYRAGARMEWDTQALRAKGCPAAESFIQHEYREGWKI
ncbi:MAG TPA: Gfo/Idh/MocA family oxidoreductase [Candidatus Limnocylindrales bacterium]|nr:Gfo/Idh/MocA family oxidoreductase [Candidatus Limnocylindrales bacterium]